MSNINKLQPIDKITIIYLLTSILLIGINTIINTKDYKVLVNAITIRIFIIVAIMLCIKLSLKFKNRILVILRNIYPFLFINYFYAETRFSKNIFFKDLDAYCIKLDKLLFRINPAIEFSAHINSPWIKELLNFGYMAYFIVIMLVPIAFYYKHPKAVKKTLFIIVTSFYLYYLIYCIIPVIGPQFFLPYPDNYVYKNGIFPCIIGFIQKLEFPTGAFPSSHVGIVLILILMCYDYKIKLLPLLLPIFTLIIFATVYIKAHYAIDVIAGIISGFAIYKLSLLLYKITSKNL